MAHTFKKINYLVSISHNTQRLNNTKFIDNTNSFPTYIIHLRLYRAKLYLLNSRTAKNNNNMKYQSNDIEAITIHNNVFGEHNFFKTVPRMLCLVATRKFYVVAISLRHRENIYLCKIMIIFGRFYRWDQLWNERI